MFVNEAFDKAINDYLNSNKDVEGKLYNSFLVVVIRMLVNIYGELDIINPFYTLNEEALDTNLTKYGANIELVNEFKFLFDMYYKTELKNKNSINKEQNIYFIEVQKKIIDLFKLKNDNYLVNETSRKEFFDLLYTPATSNPLRLSYNYLNAEDVYEVATYYHDVISQEEKKVVKDKKEILDLDVYKLFNYKLSEISQMDNDELKKVNHEIYNALNINDNAINKEYLLEEAINALKGETNKVTTGNGYVDILLVMSVIITTIMVITIFTCLVF